MALVVSPVTFPSDLADATNGYLQEQLAGVYFQGRGQGKLHKQNARSWVAFADACYEATGVTLSVVSLGDAYRSYQQQEAVFRLRYTTTPVPGTKSVRYWQGQTWYLKLGFAQVATPGTSNHGWGLAIDMCEIRPGPNVIYIASSPAWGWILANAARFGYSWEAQSEPWHIRLCTGDKTPQAVLDYENPPYIPPPTPWPPPTPPNPVYDDDMPTLYRDSRYNNVFLVNGDVTTVGPALFDSLKLRGVPLVVDTHDQSLISFMRKAEIKTGQLQQSGTPGQFNAPPDLIGN